MARGATKSSIRKPSRVRQQRTSVKRSRSTIEIPKDHWKPLPMEQRYSAMAIRQARGILRDDGIDPVAWQREIRSLGRRRLQEQEQLWRELGKNKKKRGKSSRP